MHVQTDVSVSEIQVLQKTGHLKMTLILTSDQTDIVYETTVSFRSDFTCFLADWKQSLVLYSRECIV